MGSLRPWWGVVVAILAFVLVSGVADAAPRKHWRHTPKTPAKHHVVRHHTTHTKHTTAATPRKHWHHAPAKPKANARGKWHRKDA